jgi:hypothetical protein
MANPILKFVKSVCVQTAIYWPAPTPDGYGGYTYGSAREIKVRWDSKMNEITDNEGNQIVSDAEILTTDDLDLGGRLWLGSMDDFLQDSSDVLPLPNELPQIHIIKKKETTPLFRSTDEFVRTVYTKEGT